MAGRAPRPSILRHIHVPSPVTYAHAAQLQDHLVRQMLTHKASTSASTAVSASSVLPPVPTVLTFSPAPIYTTGRRELHTPLSASQTARLSAPLRTAGAADQTAGIAAAYRGGQITFHGPGQLVVYPVLDLRALALSPRCYVHLLEGTTIALLEAYGIPARRTADPGVWLTDDPPLSSGSSSAAPATGTCSSKPAMLPSASAFPTFTCRDTPESITSKLQSGEKRGGPPFESPDGSSSNTSTLQHTPPGPPRGDHKIAALGVHLRRNITSHGLALNVCTDLRWFSRIVACGLEGKAVTSIAAALGGSSSSSSSSSGAESLDAAAASAWVERVGTAWVAEFARGLGVHEVRAAGHEELLAELRGTGGGVEAGGRGDGTG